MNEQNRSLPKTHHNFLGRFCSCDTPFNSEATSSDMLQCLICEDWFHEDCLASVPDPESFTDFICRTCIAEYPFLRALAKVQAQTQTPLDILGEEEAVEAEPTPGASTSTLVPNLY